jgi:hypothetical protein
MATIGMRRLIIIIGIIIILIPQQGHCQWRTEYEYIRDVKELVYYYSNSYDDTGLCMLTDYPVVVLKCPSPVDYRYVDNNYILGIKVVDMWMRTYDDGRLFTDRYVTALISGTKPELVVMIDENARFVRESLLNGWDVKFVVPLCMKPKVEITIPKFEIWKTTAPSE